MPQQRIRFPTGITDEELASKLRETLHDLNVEVLCHHAVVWRQVHDPTASAHMECKIDPHILAFNHKNLYLRMSFDNCLSWLVLIRVAYYHKENPLEACESIRNEVVTMEYVRSRTTIPVPRTYGFSSIIDTMFDVGAPYMFMEFKEGFYTRQPLARSAPSESLVHVAHQFGSILYQLSRLQFQGLVRITDLKDEPTVVPTTIDYVLRTVRTTYLEDNPTVIPTTIEHIVLTERNPQYPDAEDSDTRINTSLEYFFASVRYFTRGIGDFSRLAVVRFLLQAVPRAILPNRIRDPFVLAHRNLHHENIVVNESYDIVAVLDWSEIATMPIEKLACSPELMTDPELSAERNAPTVQFRTEVASKIGELAEDDSDGLGRALADLIDSPKLDVAFNLIHAVPFLGPKHVHQLVRLLYGDQVEWKDLKKWMLESPLGAY